MHTLNTVPEWQRRLAGKAPVSRYALVAGVRLHYWCWNAEHTEKPLLLLVHGFLAHGRWWDPILPELLAQYRIVSMELSGMGDSGHRAAYSVAAYADEIIGMAEQLTEGGAPLVVVGHSYGGARALRACAERPDLFRHAVVIDSFIHFEDDTRPAPPPPTAPRLRPHLAEAIASYRLLPPEPGVGQQTLEFVARHALGQVDGGWRLKFDAGLRANGKQEIEGRALLARVTTPVDLIYGEHSAVVSQAAAARAVACLPHGRGPHMVAGAHHHLPLSHPQELARLLCCLLTQPMESTPCPSP